MKTQFLYKMKYVLKGHIRSNKGFYVYLYNSNKSTVKPTLPLCFPKIVCTLLSPIPTKREGDGSLFCTLDVETQSFHRVKYDIKARFYEATFMLWRGCVPMSQSFD